MVKSVLILLSINILFLLCQPCLFQFLFYLTRQHYNAVNNYTADRNASKLLRLFYVGLLGRVFTNGPRDLGLIPGRVIPKTLKMVLDTSLLNTQQYKVPIKGKVEQSRERSSALPYTPV